MMFFWKRIVFWDNSTKTAIVKIGKNEIIVNGNNIQLSDPAEIKYGSVMIELKALASTFGADIKWD